MSWDNLKQNEFRWDGMRWDEKKWNEMKLDKIPYLYGEQARV